MAELNDNPTVSVIIPTYNRAHLIGRAILSVLNQTFHNYELIIVDDASTDNTEQVVKGFNDNRVKYIRLGNNSGGSAAPRNTAIKDARGKYIAFLDSDDEWLPEKLERQLRILKKSNRQVGVIYTGFYLIGHDQKQYFPGSDIKKKEGNIHNELLWRNFIGMPTVLIRKECFEKAGLFDESLPCYQDWELFIRMSKYFEFICIDEHLVNAYFSECSISSNKEASIKAYGLILDKHIDSFRMNKYLLARKQFYIGNCLCQTGDMQKGRKYLIRALMSNPSNMIYFIVAVLSLLGRDAYINVLRLKRKIYHIDIY